MPEATRFYLSDPNLLQPLRTLVRGICVIWSAIEKEARSLVFRLLLFRYSSSFLVLLAENEERRNPKKTPERESENSDVFFSKMKMESSEELNMLYRYLFPSFYRNLSALSLSLCIYIYMSLFFLGFCWIRES